MIKNYSASADTTITNSYKPDNLTRATGSNMGAADILEVFSIFGHLSSSSDELSRALIKFPVNMISSDRTAGTIPASGSVDFYLKLYNAPHAETLPKNFTLEVIPLIRNWQEGRGLDMSEYRDETLELEGANWIYASSGSKWESFGGGSVVGGSFKDNEINGGNTDNGNNGQRIYKQFFTDGTENLDVKITEAVEEWIAEAKATATITAPLPGAMANSKTFVLTSAEGVATTYRINGGGAYGTQAGGAAGGTFDVFIGGSPTTAAHIAEAVNKAINATTGAGYSSTRNGATVTVTQTIAGIAGNKTNIDNGTGLTVGNFTEGAGHSNYGFIIKLSGTHEAFNNASPSGMGLINLTGSEDSFYTKRFFARSSEYFFRTPKIEARWDDSVKDDTSNFYVSSALAPELDNVNTVYLYNYVRGQLQNIPAVGDGDIFVAFHTGSKRENLDPVPCEVKDLVKGTTSQLFHTFVTGGYVSTGIYSASVVVTSSLSSNNYYFPVWQYGTEETNAGRGFNNRGMTTVFTGSAIDAKLFDTRQGNPSPTFVNHMTNLKSSYSCKEKARLRLFVREENWCPNIYTIAQKEQRDLKIVEDSYYKVYRVIDDLEVVPYGTGSSTSPQVLGNNETFTRLSFDASGSYFDLDMSLMEPGYSYGIKFVHYINGDWREQPESFKFRVEE